jgi:ubiquinone/menaquinone biosynthesis C-methylase UbiE
MSDERTIRRSDEHYTPIANAYVTSTIHAQGTDLARMVELANLPVEARVLDVGTGTGHTALAFARAGANVVGYDMTRAMLREAVGLAAGRGAAFTAVQGMAESLPFADGSFDAIACRYCAHHFEDTPAAIAEMSRVLRAGGKLVFVDHVAPEDDEADAFVNRLDWLRDPSHRREPRLSEYLAWFAASGLIVTAVEHFRERMVADEWFARARTAPERESEARQLLVAAPRALRDTFAIGDDPAGFDLHMVLMVMERR